MNEVYGNNDNHVEKDSFMAKEITFYRLDDNASGFQVSACDESQNVFVLNCFQTERQLYFYVLFKWCVVSKSKVWSKYKN